ncbi:PadR family transcriptional regulator [Pengzhenrongella frigida]|uniref:PadR family transcriptional regulator n=1 Tax=Pengzhenrongella frigida TaxID=1259133 RepID=A0A4Q5N0T2_9MICO|nr:PadR family transcriptional regulator [Cellulomonas sp. HLT2-17]RYV51659.1 PadR family transcriptional regulator [Cellulomonas sp. HLT2-17]
MSSIRVFILGSLAERGEMHGHQLRLLGEEEHIHMWTDFTVGGIYGALKRLAADDLIETVRTERVGNRPERQVYAITPAGRTTLASMIRTTLTEFSLRPDPFDLALTRLDAAAVDALPQILATRRHAIAATIAAKQAKYERAAPHLTVAERHTMAHHQFRLRAELDWTDSLIADLPAIVQDEKSRKDS